MPKNREPDFLKTRQYNRKYISKKMKYSFVYILIRPRLSNQTLNVCNFVAVVVVVLNCNSETFRSVILGRYSSSFTEP